MGAVKAEDIWLLKSQRLVDSLPFFALMFEVCSVGFASIVWSSWVSCRLSDSNNSLLLFFSVSDCFLPTTRQPAWGIKPTRLDFTETHFFKGRRFLRFYFPLIHFPFTLSFSVPSHQRHFPVPPVLNSPLWCRWSVYGCMNVDVWYPISLYSPLKPSPGVSGRTSRLQLKEWRFVIGVGADLSPG